MEGDGAWVAGEVLGGVGLVLRACAACDHFLILLPCGHGVSPSGEVWDACAARSKVGPVMGLRPLRGPPCIPPEAPLEKFSASLG